MICVLVEVPECLACKWSLESKLKSSEKRPGRKTSRSRRGVDWINLIEKEVVI